MRHSQTVWRILLAVLCICITGVSATAKEHAKVEACNRVSALPVFAGDTLIRTEAMTEVRTDTTKTFDDLARELNEETSSRLASADSLTAPLDTAALRRVADSLMAAPSSQATKQPKPRFVPNPTRALWLSLVFPGAGQIYNRKYWKLPFVYGGFLGCAYALMWNQMMYRDYSQAYLDIMDDDPSTASYTEMLPPRYDITGREEQFKSIFKRKKDYYRRYRDLSAFCFIGVYLISVIDAYVDAQLSVFDISPDLSMRVKPTVISSPTLLGSRGGGSYGVGCSLNF